jgi:hypothetical protein
MHKGEVCRRDYRRGNEREDGGFLEAEEIKLRERRKGRERDNQETRANCISRALCFQVLSYSADAGGPTARPHRVGPPRSKKTNEKSKTKEKKSKRKNIHCLPSYVISLSLRKRKHVASLSLSLFLFLTTSLALSLCFSPSRSRWSLLAPKPKFKHMKRTEHSSRRKQQKHIRTLSKL